MDPVLTLVTSASVSIVVSVIAAVFGPAMTSRRARRDRVHDRFDLAQAALLRVHAARHIPNSWPRGIEAGTPEERTDYAFKATTSAIDRMTESTVEAKAALADIARYVTEADAWIRAEWELKEEDYPMMWSTIESGRGPAVRTERLFRTRAAPSSAAP